MDEVRASGIGGQCELLTVARKILDFQTIVDQSIASRPAGRFHGIIEGERTMDPKASRRKVLHWFDRSQEHATPPEDRCPKCSAKVKVKTPTAAFVRSNGSQNRTPSFFRTSPVVPILPAEPDCHPPNLLDHQDRLSDPWWLIYTKSRQEKQLMRQLRQLEIPHYGPQIVHRRRSPAGRIRTTYAPLFNNYVFLCGDDDARYQAVCTGRVQKVTPITDVPAFVNDLRQIQNLINMGVPLTLESRLEPGQNVRVRSGAFAGYEGTVLRREQETRLVVSVQFMEQGVSVKLEDCQLELIG